MTSNSILTAVRYNGSGEFEEISIERDGLRDKGRLSRSIQEVLGGGTARIAESPFVKPFCIAIGDAAELRHEPTAIIVEPLSPTGSNALFGRCLFFRKVGHNLTSVKPGDIDVIKSLPFWIRFDRFQRRQDKIPAAHELDRRFDPQVSFFVSGTEHQLTVYIGSLIGRYEFDLVSMNFARFSGDTVQVEMMLSDDDKAEELIRALPKSINRDGKLRKPWNSI